MSGDGHSLAISGSNQGLQDFNSVLQSKLVRSFPVFEHNREYQSDFFFFPIFSFVKQLCKKDWIWSMYSTMIHSKTVDVGSSIYAMKNFTTKSRWDNISSLIVPCCSLTPVFKDGALAYSCYSVTVVHARLSTAQVQQGFARDRLVLMSCSTLISPPKLYSTLDANCCISVSPFSSPLVPQTHRRLHTAHFPLEDVGSQELPLHVSSLMEEETECTTVHTPQLWLLFFLPSLGLIHGSCSLCLDLDVYYILSI